MLKTSVEVSDEVVSAMLASASQERDPSSRHQNYDGSVSLKEEDPEEPQLDMVEEDSQTTDPTTTTSTTSSDTKQPLHISSLDGVRVVAAVVIIFNHIDMINPSLASLVGGRRLEEEASMHIARFLNETALADPLLNATNTTQLVDVDLTLGTKIFQHVFAPKPLPGRLCVEVFLLLSGFVAALPGLRLLERARRYNMTRHNNKNDTDNSTTEQEEENSTSEEKDDPTSGNHNNKDTSDNSNNNILETFLNNYQKSLFKRFWRLALPVIPVHFVQLLFWHLELAASTNGKFKSGKVVREAYTRGLQSAFAFVLGGPLWVVQYFLFAPFVVVAILIPTYDRGLQGRLVWYSMVLAYLVGNVYRENTISIYLSIALGVVICDLHVSATSCNNDATARSYQHMLQHPLGTVFLVLLFALPWYPKPFHAHLFCVVLSSLAVVLLALYSRPVRYLMGNKLMSGLSTYTYELYIWHDIVLKFFGTTVRPHLDNDIWLYITGYTSVLATAFVAYWVFEKPATVFTEYLYQQFHSRGGMKQQQLQQQNSSKHL